MSYTYGLMIKADVGDVYHDPDDTQEKVFISSFWNIFKFLF